MHAETEAKVLQKTPKAVAGRASEAFVCFILFDGGLIYISIDGTLATGQLLYSWTVPFLISSSG
jgi:hypothetical protein